MPGDEAKPVCENCVSKNLKCQYATGVTFVSRILEGVFLVILFQEEGDAARGGRRDYSKTDSVIAGRIRFFVSPRHEAK